MNTNPLLSQFRISAAMQPYVIRVRPRGTDFHFGSEPEQAVAYTKCVREMRRILVEKRRIPAIAADRAILKSLEAAFDFQLADLRSRYLKTMEEPIPLSITSSEVCDSSAMPWHGCHQTPKEY
jgi:hypothetical protein